MKITEIKIDKIKVGTRFREDPGDLTDLVASIKEKGFFQPITLDKTNTLIAGHRRLCAAKEAGLTTLPVVIHQGDEVDAREIELIENIVRKDFTWPERAKLEKEILRLKKETDPNWTIEKQADLLGHSYGGTQRRIALAEVIDTIPDLADSKTEDEAWKKYKKLQEHMVLASMRDKDESKYKEAVKWAGDHYKVGNALEWIRKVRAGTVDFCEVDPPYGINLQKAKGRNKDVKLLDRYNEISVQDYPKFLETTAKQVYRILKVNTFCVWWFGPVWYSHVFHALTNAGFSVQGIPAIWTKGVSQGQTASPDTMLASHYEPFFYARKGQPKLVQAGRSNEFSFDPVPPQNKIHPTEKPLSLMKEIIQTFSYPESVVCVPFLGSGVTLRAIYANDSTGYGWDLDGMCKERFLNAVYQDKMGEDEE